MKKKILTLIIALNLAGCSGGNVVIDAVASLTWIAIYQLAGGAGFHLTQTNGTTLTTINPVVSGTGFVMPLTGCDKFYDITHIDPINTAYWLSQPLTVDYDKGMFSCDVAIQCSVGEVTMVNGIATADFTCF